MGNPTGETRDPRKMGVKASTQLLCKRLAAALNRTYPGWHWTLEADDTPTGGVLYLKSKRLHPDWGWIERLEDIQNDPHETWIVRAAGEILERFRCKPGPFNAEARARLEGLRKDARGNPIPDLSDMERARQVRQEAAIVSDAFKAGKAELRGDEDTGAWLRVNYDG